MCCSEMESTVAACEEGYSLLPFDLQLITGLDLFDKSDWDLDILCESDSGVSLNGSPVLQQQTNSLVDSLFSDEDDSSALEANLFQARVLTDETDLLDLFTFDSNPESTIDSTTATENLVVITPICLNANCIELAPSTENILSDVVNDSNWNILTTVDISNIGLPNSVCHETTKPFSEVSSSSLPTRLGRKPRKKLKSCRNNLASQAQVISLKASISQDQALMVTPFQSEDFGQSVNKRFSTSSQQWYCHFREASKEIGTKPVISKTARILAGTKLWGELSRLEKSILEEGLYLLLCSIFGPREQTELISSLNFPDGSLCDVLFPLQHSKLETVRDNLCKWGASVSACAKESFRSETAKRKRILQDDNGKSHQYSETKESSAEGTENCKHLSSSASVTEKTQFDPPSLPDPRSGTEGKSLESSQPDRLKKYRQLLREKKSGLFTLEQVVMISCAQSVVKEDEVDVME